MSYRHERKLTCTPATLEGQLKKLAKIGPAAAIEEIDNSIGNGWQSVCYSKTGGNGNGKTLFPTGPGQRHPDDRAGVGIF